MAAQKKIPEDIFHNAIEISDLSKRSAYLDDACQDDDQLRSEVEALLSSHEEAGNFLQGPLDDGDVTLDSPAQMDGPGTKIGRYELLQQIGEGGMGFVYLAQQRRPVKRQVALKIVKPGMDSHEIIGRFEAERQALALLDHPNIARVFDAGRTNTGRPYFVMEYVKGMSITRYCDDRKLSIEQRLRLFKEVCEALHHAHQKGIIHRDIKPSNIIVSVHGDRAVPKIIDFGIAKATSRPLTDKTVCTFQGQLLGTPEYMSPEQVDMATQDIDTRSDIYSLGVLLYELLTGVLPFDADLLREGGFAEIQRTIREQEPATPSTRLTALGEAAKEIAKSRRTQVITLARCLHRELEWIPLKALRKDRCRRYRSASEMSDDIQNYLNGLPLIAGPETALYRMQKFVRKHVGSVATVAIVALTVVLGLVVSAVMYFKAEEARKTEVHTRMRAEQAERKAQEQRQLAEDKAEDYRRALYTNQIATAESNCRHDDARTVRDLLESCPNDLRGWEWAYLWQISDESVMTMPSHESWPVAIAVSPDGSTLASGESSGRIHLWDAVAGHKTKSLSGHDNFANCLAYSHSGELVASSGGDRKSVKIWNTTSGLELVDCMLHEDSIQFLAFSPDDAQLISVSSKGQIRISDSSTGAEIMAYQSYGNRVNDVGLSENAGLLVLGDADGTITITALEDGSEVMTLFDNDGGIMALMCSPDGHVLASVNHRAVLKFWDLTTGVEQVSVDTQLVEPEDLAYSPDGQSVALGSSDGKVRIFEATSGRMGRTYCGHKRGICELAFSPDGLRVFSCSWDKTIKTWDMVLGGEQTTLVGHKSTVWPVGFSPDGKHLVSADEDEIVKVWDLTTGTEIWTLQGNNTRADFSPDGQHLVSGSTSGRIRLWGVNTGNLVRVLRKSSTWDLRAPQGVCFSPDGRHVLTRNWRGEVSVLDSATGTEKLRLKNQAGSLGTVGFHPEGKYIVGAISEVTVKVWDLGTGTEAAVLRPGVKPVRCITFSPDGGCVAFAGDGNLIKIWDFVSCTEIMQLQGGEEGTIAVAFSPDGKRIVAADRMGDMLRMWDTETGRRVFTTYLPGPSLNSIAFSPDGNTLAVSHGNVITLLESHSPPALHQSRRIGYVARQVADQLYNEHGSYSKVIDKLKTDNQLSEEVRTLALQIALSQERHDAEKLHKKAWQIVRNGDAGVAEYQVALEKAILASQLEPENTQVLRVLGAAQYRAGAYEDALTTFRRAGKLETKYGGQSDPKVEAFTAMSLLKSGLVKDAETALEDLRARFKGRGRWMMTRDQEACSLLFEAEKLFAGDDPRVSSLWESIRANKVEDATLQVERLRSLGEPRLTKAIRGAAILLSRVFFQNAVGRVHINPDDYKRTIADFETAVRLDPNDASALINIASMHLRFIDPELRDVAKAFKAAERACELKGWNDAQSLSMLAAACSEQGDFVSAFAHQRKAIDLLPDNTPVSRRQNYTTALRLYEASRPSHTETRRSFSHGELVACWNFDTDKEGKAVDSSGHRFHGKYVGDAVVITDPERGKVLSLDGNGDYVDCGSNPAFDISGALTIAAWMKSKPLEDSQGTLLAKGDSWKLTSALHQAVAFHSGVQPGSWSAGVVNGKLSGRDGQWHHVVGSNNGWEMKLFVDGKLENTQAGYFQIRPNRAPLWIGNNSEKLDSFWNGLIDDVHIYSYALSVDEVKVLYEGKEPPREKRTD